MEYVYIYIYIYMERNERYRNASMTKWIRNSPRSKLGPSSNLGHSVQIFPRIFSRKFPSTIFRNNLFKHEKEEGEKKREKMNHHPTTLSVCCATFYREGVLLYGRHIFPSFFSHLRFAEVFSTRRKWNSMRKIYI